MARPQSVEDEPLIARLSGVLRSVGYHAASMEVLSDATGLKKASLYHRFPRGKQQMAEEVIAAALAWYEANVFAPLKGEGSPVTRVAAVARKLDEFYASGRQACLLNMLAAPRDQNGPFSPAIKGAFQALVVAFAGIAREAGLAPELARQRAERVVMLLHGSLVMSRGLGSSEPFQTFLAGLPDDLLAPATPKRGAQP